MDLPKHEYYLISKYPILLTSTFENIPQICLQIYYLIISTDNTISGAAIFALIASSVALIFSIGTLLLRCSEDLDDVEYAIHIKLNGNEDMETIAGAIAGALDMKEHLITIDNITPAYQKLIMYLSLAIPVDKKLGKELERMKSLSNAEKEKEGISPGSFNSTTFDSERKQLRSIVAINHQDRHTQIDKNAISNGSLAEAIKLY